MTNKEIISYECERLEKIRQYLIKTWSKNWKMPRGLYIEKLGEIIYELETKIKNNGPKN